MNERLIKKLISTVKCNVCRKNYEINNIDVLGHQADTWFLNVSCHTCNRQSYVAAVIKRERAQKIITDLTEKEAAASEKISLVSSNDLLDLHSLLKDFDGDFIKLFSQR